MKKVLVLGMLMLIPATSRADLWGGDLPLLTEIVFNTLHTMYELQQQTGMMNDEMAGIKDRIDRVQTISQLVDPASWDRWRDPGEALNRLQQIYRVMPKEYRNDKYAEVDTELADAMNLTARVHPESDSAFRSGKELERRGADASPGVAQKLSASGTGSLVAVQAQSLSMQSHIVKMMAQMMAEGNERETRMVVTRGSSFRCLADRLDNKFSSIVFARKSF